MCAPRDKGKPQYLGTDNENFFSLIMQKGRFVLLCGRQVPNVLIKIPPIYQELEITRPILLELPPESLLLHDICCSRNVCTSGLPKGEHD